MTHSLLTYEIYEGTLKGQVLEFRETRCGKHRPRYWKLAVTVLRWKLHVLKLAVYCPVQEVINSIQVQVQQNGDGVLQNGQNLIGFTPVHRSSGDKSEHVRKALKLLHHVVQ